MIYLWMSMSPMMAAIYGVQAFACFALAALVARRFASPTIGCLVGATLGLLAHELVFKGFDAFVSRFGTTFYMVTPDTETNS